MAQEIKTFSTPAALQDFAKEVNASDFKEHDLTFELRILHALEDPTILAQCRDLDSCYPRDARGRRVGPKVDEEYLDLSSLDKLWREALRAIPPNRIRGLVFDATLPQALPLDGSSQPEALHWEHGGRLNVFDQKPVNLIINMATVLRMRSQGPLSFEVKFDPNKLPKKPITRMLPEVLGRLETHGYR